MKLSTDHRAAVPSDFLLNLSLPLTRKGGADFSMKGMESAFRLSRKGFAAIAAAGMAAAFGTSDARADNEYTSLYARSCSPYIVGGCEQLNSSTGLAAGLNVGSAFSFASGWNGGYALASAAFYPGAPSLLQSGLYGNYADATYGYSFQVKGQPDTLVPLHIAAIVSIAPIHLTDLSGNVADLIDGSTEPAPNPNFTQIVANANLQIGSTRRTPQGNDGARASITGSYYGNNLAGYVSYCNGCDGGGTIIDQTIWVWSNSDITVNVDANVFLEYFAPGSNATTTFATTSAEVDPTFSIDDPAYAGFTVVGVPTGVLPVPEPASWALMLGGAGLLGCGARRRRARAQG